jgi:hypothetical protein
VRFLEPAFKILCSRDFGLHFLIELQPKRAK